MQGIFSITNSTQIGSGVVVSDGGKKMSLFCYNLGEKLGGDAKISKRHHVCMAQDQLTME